MFSGLGEGALKRDPFLSIKVSAFIFKNIKAQDNEVKKCKFGHFFCRMSCQGVNKVW